MITENVSTLQIHKLTQEQYEIALENGELNDNSIYLTPTEIKDYAFKSDLETKADLVDGKIPLNQLPDNIGTNNPELSTINWENIQNKPQAYNPTEHNHNDLYYTKTEIENKNFVNASNLNSYYNKDNIDEKITALKNDDQLIAKSVEEVVNQIDVLNNSVQLKNNLVTEITDNSTDTQYPSAKIVNTKIKEIKGKIPDVSNLQENNLTTSISDSSTDSQYPSAKAVYDQLNTKQDNLTIENSPVQNNNNPISAGGVWTAVEEVMEVASGKCQTYIRDNKTDLENWLTNEMDTTLLRKGDVFLLRDVGVPDYWWEPADEIALLLEDDATSISEYSENDIIIETEEGVRKGVARILETTKVPLDDYLLASNAKTKLSEMIQDENYQTVTKAQKDTWNNKSDFDGQYDSLDGKPTLHNCATSGQAESISITKADGTIASYKIRIASEGDSGIDGYITFIV